MKFSHSALVVAVSFSVFATGASAQDGDAAGELNQFERMTACREIADDTARLACFDSTLAEVIAATESGDLQVVDEEDVRRTRRSLFGFSLPRIGLFGGDDEPDDLLETTITSVRQVRSDEWVFQTEEGAVWRIQNAPRRLRDPEAGQTVVFKRASFGSYFIRINGQMGVKGKRIG